MPSSPGGRPAKWGSRDGRRRGSNYLAWSPAALPRSENATATPGTHAPAPHSAREHELIEFRYGEDGVPEGLELGELRIHTTDDALDHTPGLPNSWMTATDIARYTGRSLSQVMQSIITKPGFPDPIHSASGRSSRLCPVAETKAFLDDRLDQVGRR